MNTIITTPDVKLFVAAVRDHLTDLSEEEREELVGGLEGDMSDLVEERGVDALPEPAEYAAELRSAAGFPEVAERGRTRPRELRGRVTNWLDRRTATWNRWVESRDHLGLPALAQSLRPVWWVLRALCATALVVEMTGTYVYGFTLKSALLAVVATLLSVQLGREAWGAAIVRRSLTARLVLIGLNLFAIAVIPVMLNRFMVAQVWAYSSEPSYDFSDQQLTFRGNPVGNIYAYDAQGHPLVGVQLVDQDGRRLTVERDEYAASTDQQLVHAPWLNGRTELYSVFPLPQAPTDEYGGQPTDEATMQTPPFASLPPVTLAGVQPSVLLTPAQVEAQRKAAVARAAKAAEARAKAAKRTKHRFVSPGQR